MDGTRSGVRSRRHASTGAFSRHGVERRLEDGQQRSQEEKEISQEEADEILGAEEARQFRGVAATLNHMRLDRSDVRYAAMEVWDSGGGSRKLGDI